MGRRSRSRAISEEYPSARAGQSHLVEAVTTCANRRSLALSKGVNELFRHVHINFKDFQCLTRAGGLYVEENIVKKVIIGKSCSPLAGRKSVKAAWRSNRDEQYSPQ